MKSRIYWGLAILIVLLIGVSVVILTRTTDTEPPIVIDRGDVGLSKNSINDLNLTPDDSHDIDESDIEKPDVDLTDQSGGKSYIVIAEDENGNDVSVRISPDHLEKLNKEAGSKFYKNIRGVSGPPPKGYKYRILPDGKVKRDEAGNPMTYKIGDPIFEVILRNKFAPTLDQYNKLKSLEQEASHAIQNGNYDKYDNISDQISTLRKESKGLLPYINITLTGNYSSLNERENAFKDATLLSKPMLYEQYRNQGFEHLIPKEYK